MKKCGDEGLSMVRGGIVEEIDKTLSEVTSMPSDVRAAK